MILELHKFLIYINPKNMKSKFLTLLLSAGILFLVASISSSCGGDDDDGGSSACNTLSKNLADQTLEWAEVLEESEDCDEIEEAYNDLIEIYEKGKNCDAFVKAVKAAGYDSVNQFINELEESRDDFLEGC